MEKKFWTLNSAVTEWCRLTTSVSRTSQVCFSPFRPWNQLPADLTEKFDSKTRGVFLSYFLLHSNKKCSGWRRHVWKRWAVMTVSSQQRCHWERHVLHNKLCFLLFGLTFALNTKPIFTGARFDKTMTINAISRCVFVRRPVLWHCVRTWVSLNWGWVIRFYFGWKCDQKL